MPVTYSKIKRSELRDYSMAWRGKLDCIVAGHIQLMNHSEPGTVGLFRDIRHKTISAYAKKFIHAGEELTFDYACKLWFQPEN